MPGSEISIRPGVGMLGLFPHMKYQPWYALSELVDNALQSYLSHKDALLQSDPRFKLVVKISIDRADGGPIIIQDNAAGISGQDWERAFQVAEPPPDATGLSQFGIGMKAACSWFARIWSVRSTAYGESITRTVTFDVPTIVATREEHLVVEEEDSLVGDHFTVIEMSGLYRPVAARTLGKIRSYLGGIYRHFLRRGDLTLMVNGEAVGYSDTAILEAARYNDSGGAEHVWRKEVALVLDSGRQVTGYVAIRETGDTRQAGLALLYRNKVITGSGEEFYKPWEIFKGGNSFESQRIFGELYMDGFSVTYTKDALVWYDEEEEFIEKLRAQLDAEPFPLIKQAREYRKRSPELASTDVANSLLDNIVDSFGNLDGDIEGADSDDTWNEPRFNDAMGSIQNRDVPEPPRLTATAVDRRVTIPYQGVQWEVDLKLVADQAVTRWLTVGRIAEYSLELKVNQAHPFMRAYCELPGQEFEPVWRVAIALGLAQEMARLGGAEMPGLVTENVNNLLRTVLSHKR